MKTRVIRSPSAPFGYLSCLIGLLGGGAAFAANNWPVALAFLLISFAIGIRGAREAVVLGHDGLVIRNPLRTYRLPWSEVDDIQVAERRSLLSEMSPSPVGSVITTRGRRIRLGITRTIYQRSWTANEKVDDIRQAWKTTQEQA
ncbi:MAG: PH domain-containing protein [Actinomycetota bacterium]|nr:PH domain-containing protein [Actinomycetota bacterium]